MNKNKMIQFKEGQEKIFVGKNKITKSFNGYLNLHIVYSIESLNNIESGYDAKFVRVIAFENIYDFDTIKNIVSDDFEDIFDIKYFLRILWVKRNV